MASGTGQAISSEELRRRLYQTFKNRGVLDSLKSQLRNQLVHELTRPDLNGRLLSHGHHRQHSSTDENSLLIMAANSIVADHLSRTGYEYSLSVFFPECGLEKEKVFTSKDLLQIMKISSRSELYKSIISHHQKDHDKGFLIQFLMELTDHRLTKDYRDAEVQTSCIPQYKESIVDKLQMIDEEYATYQPTNMQEDFWETKLLKYRKQIEEQLQAELQQEMQHFKDVELAKIQIQEKERSRKDGEDHRLKLDKMYQLKAETLIAREKNAIERLQKQQEVEEKEIYMQRQSLLKDIEALRNREVELRQRIESFELTQNLHGQKNKSIEDSLQRRELSVKNIEESYEQKLKNELCKYQLELQDDYRKRMEKVAVNEKRIEAEAARLHEESLIIHSSKVEHQQIRAQAMKLEVELNEAKSQICLLVKQNELLNERLQDTADHASLKTENIQFQTEIRLLRKQLDEARCENQTLCTMLNEPSAAHTALQAELKKTEYSRKVDQDEYQRQKEIFEQQLKNEVERCAQVRSQLLEFDDQTRRLNGQVDDLKLQLRQTQLGEDGSFMVCVPGVSEHQSSITTSQVQSCDFQVVNTANCPLSAICAANERSENNQIDNPVSMPSTFPRFKERLDQPDDQCEIMQEGISMLNENVSQWWQENGDKGSVSSQGEKIISIPADACKMERIEDVSKHSEDEEESKEEEGEIGEDDGESKEDEDNQRVKENAWEDQIQRDQEKQCLEIQGSREREETEPELQEQENIEEKPVLDQGGQSPEGQTPEIVELPASSADLLEKYMKLVQQQKEEEQQQDESSKKDVGDESSLSQTLSGGKIGSPAASHEETEETFW
ncbi:oral-facial-digital syndrome 1 protein isoform X3 [Amblyraja radiata]|uniref:oral-facial-digital syndrome 1 protein isoform X3 n=1 Tax=Amblyraja radiata TaxID=386614 RepID=UPI00140388D2|nr:oral-facial-digital syndrome 1 protein isoform X3 [Amblyraja radiata]